MSSVSTEGGEAACAAVVLSLLCLPECAIGWMPACCSSCIASSALWNSTSDTSVRPALATRAEAGILVHVQVSLELRMHISFRPLSKCQALKASKLAE